MGPSPPSYPQGGEPGHPLGAHCLPPGDHAPPARAGATLQAGPRTWAVGALGVLPSGGAPCSPQSSLPCPGCKGGGEGGHGHSTGAGGVTAVLCPMMLTAEARFSSREPRAGLIRAGGSSPAPRGRPLNHPAGQRGSRTPTPGERVHPSSAAPRPPRRASCLSSVSFSLHCSPSTPHLLSLCLFPSLSPLLSLSHPSISKSVCLFPPSL